MSPLRYLALGLPEASQTSLPGTRRDHSCQEDVYPSTNPHSMEVGLGLGITGVSISRGPQNKTPNIITRISFFYEDS